MPWSGAEGVTSTQSQPPNCWMTSALELNGIVQVDGPGSVKDAQYCCFYRFAWITAQQTQNATSTTDNGCHIGVAATQLDEISTKLTGTKQVYAQGGVKNRPALLHINVNASCNITTNPIDHLKMHTDCTMYP